MLDEYISLEEHKVFLDQERFRLDHGKTRVQSLLNGMQHVMNAYNASVNPAPPSSIAAAASSVPKTGALPSIVNGSSPVTSDPSIDAQPTSSAKHNSILNSSVVQLSDPLTASDKPRFQGSNVAKSLFNQPIQSPPTNSSGPKTPPRASSSQTDKSTSPLEFCSTATSGKITPSLVTATNCKIISSETIRLSPSKQIIYSIERNHCISTSSPGKTNLKRSIRRDQVKSRLDFDASDNMPCNSEMAAGLDMISTSESEKEGDIFDLDLPNLDALGVDFNLSELLFDFGLDGEGIGHSCQPAFHSSPDSFSGSPYASGNVNTDANLMTSQIASTVTEVFSDQDMNLLGSDSLTTTKSVTKCIQILSPVKNIRILKD
ncbi:unnamed protein product [Withania somnifera]